MNVNRKQIKPADENSCTSSVFFGPVRVFCSSPFNRRLWQPCTLWKNSLCFTDLCADIAFHTLNRVPLLGRFVFTTSQSFPHRNPPFFFFWQQRESVNRCFTVLTVMPKIENTKRHTALLWVCRVATFGRLLHTPIHTPRSHFQCVSWMFIGNIHYWC